MRERCPCSVRHWTTIWKTYTEIITPSTPTGKAANPSFDGLFSTSLAFTLGYGSKFGRGYVVNVEIRTLDKVSQYEEADIRGAAFSFISQNLKKYLPDNDLQIVQDGNVMKIIGDFSLGEV